MFRQPRPLPTDATTPSTVVDQPPLGVPNHDHGCRQDPHHEGDDQLTDERSTLCATAHESDVSSATDSGEPLEPPAFQGFIGSQETDQGTGRNISDGSVATEPTVAQRGPNVSRNVLKHLERHGGGRATCLWLYGGSYECGYSSQIDLVKRHIKRVHYCLRWVAYSLL